MNRTIQVTCSACRAPLKVQLLAGYEPKPDEQWLCVRCTRKRLKEVWADAAKASETEAR